MLVAFSQDRRVTGGQTVKNQAGHFGCHARAFGNGGLAGALPLRIDSCRHVPRQQQIGIVDVEQTLGRIHVCGGIDELLNRPGLTLRSPMFDALPQQPHPVYVFQKIDPAANAALVAEVFAGAPPR